MSENNGSGQHTETVKGVTINSHQDLRTYVQKLTEDHQAQTPTNTQRIQNVVQGLRQMIQNIGATDMIRTEFLRFLLDGPRDIDGECGYPLVLTPDHYRAMYDRDGISRRVVHCEPEESWQMDPEVYEDEDPEKDTEFEKAWKDNCKKWNFYQFLQRIDILSGIGQYGVLLLGLNDGKELWEPVDGFNDDGTIDEGNDYNLLYLRVFDETVIWTKVRETDINNPRYGLPKLYTIQFRDFPNWGIQAGEIIARDVHWSRVIHVADNRKMSEVYGQPRMQEVYNYLYNLRKIYSADGEAFWKNGFAALAFEMSPEVADQGIPLDKDGIRKEMERFQNGTQRYIALEGMTVKTLPPAVVDPTPHTKVHLTAIATSKAIPYRILFGSEEAKLAGEKDSEAWNKRVARRQSMYVTPMLLRPFVDRMIAYGVLPKPKVEYFVDWPDLNAPSDQDKATVALTKTQAMAAYIQSGLSQLMSPRDFYVTILSMSVEEADSLLDNAADFNGSEGDQNDDSQFDEDQPNFPKDQEETESNEGGLGGANPDNGSNLEQKNLSRRTTVGGGQAVDAQLVQQPSLNSEMVSMPAMGFAKLVSELVGNEWSKEAEEARWAGHVKEDRSSQRSQRARVGELHPASKEGKGKDSTIKMGDGSAAPNHIKASMIPPAYRHNLKVSKDKNADVWAESEDEKGNKKRVYNPKFLKSNQDIKWGRVREGVDKVGDIRDQIHKDRSKGENKNEADAAWLMSEQATRPGSESDTKGNKQLWDTKIDKSNVEVTPAKGKGESKVVLKIGKTTVPIRDTGAKEELLKRVKSGGDLGDAGFWLKSHGATTLEGRHVTADNKGGARVQFMGKEGVWHDHKIQNSQLASMLLDRKAKAGDRGNLFGTNYDKVSKYVGGLGGGNFSPKDLRTIRANEMAHKMIGEGKSVGSEKEKDAFKRQVAEHVSNTLGNRPQQALESYIDPKVFDKVKVESTRKEAA